MAFEVVSLERLRAVAALSPETDVRGGSQRLTPNSYRRLRVGDWLNDREIPFRIKDAPTTDGRTVYLLEKCPFNPEHGNGGDVCIMQSPSGKLSAKCHHNSCAENGWAKFRDAIGRPDSQLYEDVIEAGGSQAAANEFSLNLMHSAVFDAADFRMNYLIRHVLVEGQPCIVGGPKKCLKTGTLVDLAVSLGTATPFLSNPEFTVPERIRTCLLSGESGASTLRSTARRVCQARQLKVTDADILWGLDLPQLANPGHLAALVDTIEQESIRVLIIDPAYLCLLSGVAQVNPGNVFAMGEILKGIGDLGTQTGCTIIIAHHTRKKDRKERYHPTDLEDLAMAGFAEFARQWILLGRKSEYQSDGHHDLWLNIGGSAGHSGCYALTVDESPPNILLSQRIWRTQVDRATLAIERDKQNKQKQQAEELRLTKLNALEATIRGCPEGETKSQLRNMMKPCPTGADFDLLVGELINVGKVETCKILKNKRKESGFRPSNLLVGNGQQCRPSLTVSDRFAARSGKGYV